MPITQSDILGHANVPSTTHPVSFDLESGINVGFNPLCENTMKREWADSYYGLLKPYFIDVGQ